MITFISGMAAGAAAQSVRRRANRAASAVTSAEITRGCRRQRDYEATNLNHSAPMPEKKKRPEEW